MNVVGEQGNGRLRNARVDPRFGRLRIRAFVDSRLPPKEMTVCQSNHGLMFQVEYLLREWVRLCHQPGAGKESEKAFSTFVSLVRNSFFL